MDFSAGKEGRTVSGIHIEGLYSLDSTTKAVVLVFAAVGVV